MGPMPPEGASPQWQKKLPMAYRSSNVRYLVLAATVFLIRDWTAGRNQCIHAVKATTPGT